MQKCDGSCVLTLDFTRVNKLVIHYVMDLFTPFTTSLEAIYGL